MSDCNINDNIINEENIITNFKKRYPMSTYTINPILKTVNIKHDYYNEIEDIPSEITRITFNNLKNIDNLPNTIIRLNLKYLFNQSLDNLWNSLQELSISSTYKFNINNLPNSLKKLTLFDT